MLVTEGGGEERHGARGLTSRFYTLLPALSCRYTLAEDKIRNRIDLYQRKLMV